MGLTPPWVSSWRHFSNKLSCSFSVVPVLWWMSWNLKLKYFIAALDGFLLLLHGAIFCSLIWPYMEFMLSWGLLQVVFHRLRTHACKGRPFLCSGLGAWSFMADSVFASIFWDPHPRGIDTGFNFSVDFSPLHSQALGCSVLP